MHTVEPRTVELGARTNVRMGVVLDELKGRLASDRHCAHAPEQNETRREDRREAKSPRRRLLVRLDGRPVACRFHVAGGLCARRGPNAGRSTRPDDGGGAPRARRGGSTRLDDHAGGSRSILSGEGGQGDRRRAA
mmetsp:Transcript_32226/g.96849  ORF Transcript_32226/g.96849 Transcript_32226/m.96849 type:complete len:135 (-) Transcript_32226:314-718(-)